MHFDFESVHVCYFDIDLGMSSLSNKWEPFFWFLLSPVMYSDDSVTFDLCFTHTLTFDSSFLYFDPMYENERTWNLVENNSYCKYDIVPLLRTVAMNFVLA